jgi:hypothetical protein
MPDQVQTRTCPKCIQTYPLTAEFWSRNRTRSDGFDAYCLVCKRVYSKGLTAQNRQKNATVYRTDVENFMSAPPLFGDEKAVAAPDPRETPPPEPVTYSPPVIPDLTLPRDGKDVVVAIGDIHYPFHDERAVRLALEVVGDLKPAIVIQMGDLYDQLSYSKWARSFNVYTPKYELDLARWMAEGFWARVAQIVPDARRIQRLGNHDDRAFKRLIEHAPALEHISAPGLAKLYFFDGVETGLESREEWSYQDVWYMHGHRRAGQHMAWNRRNTVVGHSHVGGVLYKQADGGTFWELNVGYLGDPRQPCFTYNTQKRSHGWTQGVGVIDRYGPRFIPF